MRLTVIFFLFTLQLFAQKVNQTDEKGLKQGIWRKYHSNGRLEYEGTFIDGKPSGIFKYFYDDGRKKALIEHNLKTGRSLANFFHQNGQMMSGGIYRNQQKDSTWVTFTESGIISEISNYQNNLLHGPKTTYYISGLENSNGRIVYTKSNYKNGNLDGEYIEFFMDGLKKLQTFYVDGKLQGMYTEYNRSGVKSTMFRYKNGLKHGYGAAYDEKGKEIKTVYYYKGRYLEGKELERHLNYCKSKGIDPNE
jgi:antitoxin component YwqK of YwqJK toxin-antitoxin module